MTKFLTMRSRKGVAQSAHNVKFMIIRLYSTVYGRERKKKGGEATAQLLKLRGAVR